MQILSTESVAIIEQLQLSYFDFRTGQETMGQQVTVEKIMQRRLLQLADCSLLVHHKVVTWLIHQQ